jgi:hypothetical protein
MAPALLLVCKSGLWTKDVKVAAFLVESAIKSKWSLATRTRCVKQVEIDF